jgi:hypothetical protein
MGTRSPERARPRAQRFYEKNRRRERIARRAVAM